MLENLVYIERRMSKRSTLDCHLDIVIKWDGQEPLAVARQPNWFPKGAITARVAGDAPGPSSILHMRYIPVGRHVWTWS